MFKIMIVDDSPEILEALQLIFELEDYDVVVAYSGNAIIQKVYLHQPDIILLDIMLGDFDGRDICREIKDDDMIKKIPIIMISSTHGINTFLQLKCEPDGYMAKPFNVAELTALVASKLA